MERTCASRFLPRHSSDVLRVHACNRVGAWNAQGSGRRKRVDDNLNEVVKTMRENTAEAKRFREEYTRGVDLTASLMRDLISTLTAHRQ